MDIVFEGEQIILVEVVNKRADLRRNLVILGNGFTIGDPGFHLPSARNFARFGNVLAMFFKPNCVGLEAAEKELAKFINKESQKYTRVALYGHSKCGVMFYNMLPRIKNPVTVITVSAPFAGYFWADVQKVRKRLWEKKSLLGKIFTGWQYFLYNKMFPNRAVDCDLIPGSDYLKKERPELTISHKIANVVSCCYSPARELRRCSLFRFIYAKMNILAKYGVEHGDGVVSISSQQARSIKVNFFVHGTHPESFDKARVILNSYLG